MLRTAWLALVVALAAAAPASAQTFTLGSPGLVEITIPRTWEPSETDNGVEATSPDGLLYMSAEVHPSGPDGAGVETAVSDAFQWVIDQGVRFEGTMPAPETITPFNEWGGAIAVTWTGRDAQRARTVVSVTAVKLDADNALILMGWASNDGDQTNLAALTRIVQSVRSARRR